ncbi:hypothetical protein RM844_05790 [Streptomyces sp. DSM 44915]|uniref:Uncharacterized protein n=1 Tax=Streptomyces chisholmiae TaxID=3075540 RepID=A0ABU2JLE3_9ACTN|nr:hypothetical protein [Streptomyces sp. DSM 44915]MDT0265799.1 hypothetical protein [Streptomyces sp. DSM 44915]
MTGVGWEFLAPEPGPDSADPEAGWVLGPCWFFCGHRVTAVAWLGAVSTAGASAPLYACGPCLERLHAMVWDFTEASWSTPTDATGRALPLYPALGPQPPPAPTVHRGRHRRPRTPFGARLNRARATTN